MSLVSLAQELEEAAQTLPEFALRDTAELVAQKLRIDDGCHCGSMLQDNSIRCPIHPYVRVKTPFERMDFEREWDVRVMDNA